MRLNGFTIKLSMALLGLLATAGIMAGCGGGGGGGGSSSGGSTSGGGSSTSYVYSGTVTSAGSGVSGAVVEFDGNASYKATTDSNGNFSITVPSSVVTGNDTISAALGGSNIGTIALTNTKGDTNIQITAGPPPPPSNV